MANEVKLKNLQSFQKALEKRLMQIIEKKVPAAYKKIVFDALRGFVLGTRVDTGRARGGWQVTLNRPEKSSSDEVVLDKTGSKSLNNGLQRLSKVKNTDIVYVQNRVKYIGKLEQWDRMVDNTLKTLTAKIKAGDL